MVDAAASYLHVADDGGVLHVDGSGRSAWVAAGALPGLLAGLAATGGTVLLSREDGTPVAAPVLDLVVGSGLPIVQANEVHPDAQRRDGATALMAFAYVGALPLLVDLLERGAPLEARDDSGYTALMYAARAGEVEAIDALLAAGADVGAADRDGSTPLMFAAAAGSLPAVRRLLAAGADPSIRRPDGVDARAAADAAGHPKVAAAIASLGSTGSLG